METLKHNECLEQFGKRTHRRLVTPPGCEWIGPNLAPSYTWFLGHHVGNMSQSPNGISIDSAVFEQHTRVTNTQTDHATCDICSNRPHLCSACMRRGL